MSGENANIRKCWKIFWCFDCAAKIALSHGTPFLKLCTLPIIVYIIRLMFTTLPNGFKSENNASFGAPRSQPFSFSSNNAPQTQSSTNDDAAMEDDIDPNATQKSSFTFGKRSFSTFINQTGSAQAQPSYCQTPQPFGRGASANNFATSKNQPFGAHRSVETSQSIGFGSNQTNKGFQNTFGQTLHKEPFGHASGWTKSISSAQPNGLAQFSLPSNGLFPTNVNQKAVLSKTDMCESCNCAIGESPEPYVIHRFKNTSDDDRIAVDDQQIFCSMICMARGISEAYNDVYGDLDDDE